MIKNNKAISVILSTIIISGNVTTAYSAEIGTLEKSIQTQVSNNTETNKELKDGLYTINNDVLKDNSDSESYARQYVEKDSDISVENGIIYVTLKFNNGKVISDISLSVNGNEKEYNILKSSDNEYYIKFSLDSLNDEILATCNINTGIPFIGIMKGVKFRVLLDDNTLSKVSVEDEEVPDNEETEDGFTGSDDGTSDGSNSENEDTSNDEDISNDKLDGESLGSSSNNGITSDTGNAGITENTTNNQSSKYVYKVNNEIVTDSAIGYQAARSAVSETSYYEINSGKKYITLAFSQTDVMNNIRVSINGSYVNYQIINENSDNNTVEIKFEIPSISNTITVITNITAMGRDISFGVRFLESSLQLISTEENIVLPLISEESNKTQSGIINNLLSSTAETSSTLDELIVNDEDIVEEAKEYFKKYTISNEIISDSAIGRSMARKYVNETSLIEEIDGKFYATITFSSSNSMDNFKITVNEEDVDYSVVLNDATNNIISLRFPISSVNDDIRIYIYITSVKMNIDFGIRFLEDTMILIDEGVIESEDKLNQDLEQIIIDLNEEDLNTKSITSPVKAAVTASVIVLILNNLIIGLIVYFKKKKKESV